MITNQLAVETVLTLSTRYRHDQLQDVLRRHGMLLDTGTQHGDTPK